MERSILERNLQGRIFFARQGEFKGANSRLEVHQALIFHTNLSQRSIFRLYYPNKKIHNILGKITTLQGHLLSHHRQRN